MASWTVVVGKELRDRLLSIREALVRAADEASLARSPHLSEALDRFDEFEAFAATLNDLPYGRADPEQRLRMSPLRTHYSFTAVLTVGSWQCEFLIDRKRRRCTAIAIRPVSPMTEAMKNLFRRPLRPDWP